MLGKTWCHRQATRRAQAVVANELNNRLIHTRLNAEVIRTNCNRVFKRCEWFLHTGALQSDRSFERAGVKHGCPTAWRTM